jgi:hypothetical protein
MKGLGERHYKTAQTQSKNAGAACPQFMWLAITEQPLGGLPAASNDRFWCTGQKTCYHRTGPIPAAANQWAGQHALTPQGRSLLMRILLTAKMPHEPFNAAVKEGIAGEKLTRILDAIKPEAVYFTDQDGVRTALVVVELADASKIPALAEPWFQTFHADVRLQVVMTPDDLKKAELDKLGKLWS